ncbi:MAG: TldD/PmbA family protein [Actinobacteria bacterium]|nr:MAG: TldD/PmbA family protein [Actinomycetota bacterium]
MRPRTPAEALDLAKRAVALTRADEAEALVAVSEGALTRFAGNRIHQNVAQSDAEVSVRAVLGKRVGVASTNRLDDASLAACCDAAAAAARVAPEDPGFPGLPAAGENAFADRSADSVAGFGADSRARAAAGLIAQAAERGLTAAGKVEVSRGAIAVANSAGTAAAMAAGDLSANVLAMGDDGGSGWASFVSGEASDLSAEALGARAADLASRSADPGDLEPGAYAVVLAPDAVASLLEYLAYVGFSAKDVEEGSSFMSGRIGERLLSERVTIADDAAGAGALGLAFDYEGVPKRRTVIVDAGVAAGPVTDSYWAARTGRPNTGHALPAPNRWGPQALDLVMDSGDSSIDEMIASVERGVYVTRFHYVNVEEPVRAVLTGMTRDGTFLIEDGRLARPLKNQRFTQSAVDALTNVRAVGRTLTAVRADFGTFRVPAMTVDGFTLTGQTG